MSNPTLQKSYIAGGAIPAFTVVKLSADTGVVAAAAVSDFSLGVSGDIAAASGERCDVIMSGIANVLAGAAITRGALLTVDSSGRVVTAAPSAGVNNRIIGIALEAAGAANDVIRMLISQGSVQG